MSSLNAFDVSGQNCYAIDLTDSASTAVQIAANGAPSNQYLIDNSGPNAAGCFLAFSAEDDVEAVEPVDGSPANGVHIGAGVIMVLTAPPNAYVSGICAATESTTIYITPGIGV